MQIGVQEVNVLWEASDEIKNILQTGREVILQNLEGGREDSMCLLDK
jgi:hypothetical protein